MYTIQGHSADQAWTRAVERLLNYGAEVPSRVSKTVELQPVSLHVLNPRMRLVTAFGRPVNPAFSLAEVIWILCGARDVESLRRFNSKIGDYSDNGTTFNAAYGHRLRFEFGHDQLEDMIWGLQSDPDSRQAVLNIWSPARDAAFIGDQKNRTKDRACNLVGHALIRNERLNWMQVMRSNDAMWGTPNNFMQWMHVQEWVARSVSVEVGTYTHIADSFHVYDYHLEEAKRVQPFDLYSELNLYGHSDMKVGDSVLNALRDQLSWPEDVYRVYDASLLGTYWSNVAEIFRAWDFYKKGEDIAAVRTLLSMTDHVLAASQLRYFWWFRWGLRKNPNDVAVIDSMMRDGGHHWLSPTIIGWIQAGVKSK